MIGFIVFGVVTTVIVLVMVAHSKWAAQRGWVLNNHNPRPSGSGIPRPVDEVYQPGVEHVINEETSELTRADRTEAGGPPTVWRGAPTGLHDSASGGLGAAIK